MDDESKFQELTSRDEALDRLGSDLGIITDRTGAVLAVTGPTRADLGGSITEGSELADLVHADDRAALLTLLTGRRNTESNIELRLRHAQRWWRTIAVTALVMGNDEIALVGTDVTETIRDRACLDAYEAIVGVTNEDVPYGVALDAVARCAQAAVPGARAAIYVRRDHEFELAAAPNLDSSWSRRAFRFDAQDLLDDEADFVRPGSRRLAELASEFRLGCSWTIAPDISRYEAADIVCCLFIGEKRFFSADERSALARVSDLLSMTQRSESRRVAAHDSLRNDELTGVTVRRTMLRDIARSPAPMMVALISVSGLAQLNEDHGYEVGDAVMQSVAGALRSTTRGRDNIGRLTGTTFVVHGAARAARPGRDAQRADRGWVERVTAAVSGPVVAAGVVVAPKCVVVEAVSADGETNRELLQRAERELRAAKDAIEQSVTLSAGNAAEHELSPSAERHSGFVANDR